MTPEQIAGRAMGAPVTPQIMETGSIVFWLVLAALAVVLTLRNRKIPLFGLVLIAATSAFWQEFFADWGAYLAWNPAFERLPLWGDMAYTTSVKPLFVPFSWGWWFALSIPLLVSLVIALRHRFARLSVGMLAALTAFPLFLVYQIYVEGSSVANGWWTYDSIVGPALESEKGRLPLIFPLLIGIWAGWFVALLASRDDGGFMWHERAMGVAAHPAGLRRELARIWAMIVAFQLTFLIVNTAPAILGRLLFGGPSAMVP